MKELPELAVLGAGNMASALLHASAGKFFTAPNRVHIFDIDSAKSKKLADSCGASVSDSMVSCLQDAPRVLLAVKPQVIPALCRELISAAGSNYSDLLKPETLIISIAAGVSIQTIKELFKRPEQPIARVMPNTPCLVGKSAGAVCFSTEVTEKCAEWMIEFLKNCGFFCRLSEKLFDAVTGLSGSGPAYVFLFIEALADAGVRWGLTRDDALSLAAHTVRGSAEMILQTGSHPSVLKDMVASPGGTTIRGLEALEQSGFRGAVMSAVNAACARAAELGKAGR